MPTIDLARMRYHVRKPVGTIDPTDPDLLDADIDDYLNFSYWEVMDKFPFREKQRELTFQLTRGLRNYEVPRPVEAITEVAIINDVDSRHIPLDQMDARRTEYLYQEGEQFWGLPKEYLIENCYIRVWPTPDKNYTLVMRKNTILEDIQASGIDIPQIWNEIVIFGAIARAFKGLGDIARGRAYQQDQVAMIQTTTPRPEKEAGIDRQHAGVIVLGRNYDI